MEELSEEEKREFNKELEIIRYRLRDTVLFRFNQLEEASKRLRNKKKIPERKIKYFETHRKNEIRECLRAPWPPINSRRSRIDRRNQPYRGREALEHQKNVLSHRLFLVEQVSYRQIDEDTKRLLEAGVAKVKVDHIARQLKEALKKRLKNDPTIIERKFFQTDSDLELFHQKSAQSREKSGHLLRHLRAYPRHSKRKTTPS